MSLPARCIKCDSSRGKLSILRTHDLSRPHEISVFALYVCAHCGEELVHTHYEIPPEHSSIGEPEQ